MKINEIIVPTVDSIRISYLFKKLAINKKNLILVG